MTRLLLDDIDKRLVNTVQAEFPLTVRPYADLGLQLGIGEGEVIQRIIRLKTKRIIRLIGPVLDARSLGYQTTLVAMRVAGEQRVRAEQAIARHPGVSHGYEREHYFNIWFTFAAHAQSIEDELKQLTDSIPAEAVLSLPAVKIFKIGAYFDMYGYGQTVDNSAQPRAELPGRVELSLEDKDVIRCLPQDLSLVSMPFTDIAERSGMGVEDFLSRCRALLQRGVIRRFGAAINHRHAGYTANAMACWIAPTDMVDIAGQKLASLREVSHCYERKTSGLWRHNLFAMIHHRTRTGCQAIVSRISEETRLKDSVVLFSTREFKKTRVRYQV